MEPKNEQIHEKNVYKNTKESYEEISEKKTSKLGYILLVIMVFFVIGVGETVFSDLKDLPKEPISPSYCILSSIENLENLSYLDCPGHDGFNETDKMFSLDVKFLAINKELQNISELNTQIDENDSNINQLGDSIKNLSENYDLSLQEKMASEDAIMNRPEIKNDIINSRTQINSLQTDIAQKEQQRNEIISRITPAVSELQQSYQEADENYFNAVAWYQFKIFLFTLIFILPFFALSLYFYLKLKQKNSPYTIILTAVMTAFSILFLQVVGTFLYDILPKTWFYRIFEFFMEISFLRYVIYYGSVILVIGIFGGIVYYIQKKVYSPTKVAIRRLKDKKCPRCSFALDPNHNFCPDCGLQLKEKCEQCGNLKIRYLSHCPSCGKN